MKRYLFPVAAALAFALGVTGGCPGRRSSGQEPSRQATCPGSGRRPRPQPDPGFAPHPPHGCGRSASSGATEARRARRSPSRRTGTRRSSTAPSRKRGAEAQAKPQRSPSRSIALRATTLSIYEHTRAAEDPRRTGLSRGAARTRAASSSSTSASRRSHTAATGRSSSPAASRRTGRSRTRCSATRAATSRASRRAPPRSIELARGTSNYHPSLPSAYTAGVAGPARRTGSGASSLRQRPRRRTSRPPPPTTPSPPGTRPSARRVSSSTASARRCTGTRSSTTARSTAESARSGAPGRRGTSPAGYRNTKALPEIYNSAMAQQWAELARIARGRYHRAVHFAGVMTQGTRELQLRAAADRRASTSSRRRSTPRASARCSCLPAARTSSVRGGHGIGAGSEPAPVSGVQDPEGERGGVACVVDADRRHGNAGRHLRDREQRVEPVEHAEARAQGDADHRQVRLRRHRSR